MSAPPGDVRRAWCALITITKVRRMRAWYETTNSLSLSADGSGAGLWSFALTALYPRVNDACRPFRRRIGWEIANRGKSK